MVSWNDLPSDVCRAILFEFVNVVADEYSERRDWCGRKIAKRIEKYGTAERIFAMLEAGGDESDDSSEEDEEDEEDEDEWDDRSKLEKRLESAGPLPLSWFASALRVNREFSSILTSITIGGYRAPEKLKRAQCEMFEFALKYFEYEYKNVDGQYYMSLYDLTTLVGNFWANFDCFQHGVNIVSHEFPSLCIDAGTRSFPTYSLSCNVSLKPSPLPHRQPRKMRITGWNLTLTRRPTLLRNCTAKRVVVTFLSAEEIEGTRRLRFSGLSGFLRILPRCYPI